MIDVLRRLGYAPRFCVWELTLACDLRCKHCGSFAGKRRADELSLEECLQVADDLAALGCQKVTLGGGEPTLHPQWHEIGRRLSDRGVRVNIISNGFGWSEREVARARHARLTNAAFSLDGFEEHHDRVRKPGSYARVVHAIELCRAAGLPASVVTHINQLNARTLPEFRQHLCRLGVASWQIQLGIPSGTMSEHQELVIAPEDLLWLVPQIAELRRAHPDSPFIFPSDNVGYYGRPEPLIRDKGAQVKFWIGCRAGCQAIGIESNGGVKGCLSLPSAMHGKDVFSEGNLRQRPLAEIWRDPDNFAYNRKFSEAQLAGFCGVCRYRDICRGGCAWTAYSHTANRFDNPYCFYRQAVRAGRRDLLDEDPTPEELAHVKAHP